MRKIAIGLAATALLAIPFIGLGQQVPGNVQVPGPVNTEKAITDLRVLTKAQTQAIQALQARVVALEARVEKIEKEKPAKGGT